MVLRLRTDAPDDWERAKCRNIVVSRDYDPFFSEEEDEIKEAVSFCNGDADGIVCPIRHECLIFSLTNNCKEGVWGGTNEITRRAMRKKYPPARGHKVREEWKWQTEQESLRGLRKEDLLKEAEEESRRLTEDSQTTQG